MRLRVVHRIGMSRQHEDCRGRRHKTDAEPTNFGNAAVFNEEQVPPAWIPR